MARRRTKVSFREVVTVKQQKQKKKKQSAPKPRQPRQKIASLTRDLTCSVLNPFECSACIPDGRTNTGCFTLKQTGTLGTGAAGGACGIYVCPNPQAIYYPDGSSTATTTTISGNWSQVSIATVSAQYESYRPVSCGLRVTYVGNTQTDQGIIVAGQLALGQAISTLNGLTAAGLANASANYQQVPLRNGAQVIWRPESMNDMMDFVPFSSSTSAVSINTEAPVIYCAVFGGNASTPALLQYEFTVNFEGQFLSSSYIPGGIQSSSKAMPMAEPGWYENMKNIVDRVSPIVPMVGSILTATGMPGAQMLGNLASLANGIIYPSTRAKTSRVGI